MRIKEYSWDRSGQFYHPFAAENPVEQQVGFAGNLAAQQLFTPVEISLNKEGLLLPTE